MTDRTKTICLPIFDLRGEKVLAVRVIKDVENFHNFKF
jgi:hypothetical protein